MKTRTLFSKLFLIKLLNTLYPLGFNDSIFIMKGSFLDYPILLFSLLDIRKRNQQSHGRHKI